MLPLDLAGLRRGLASLFRFIPMLNKICDFLDEFLEIEEIEDYPNALIPPDYDRSNLFRR
jgi:hypothetical protein